MKSLITPIITLTSLAALAVACGSNDKSGSNPSGTAGTGGTAGMTGTSGAAGTTTAGSAGMVGGAGTAGASGGGGMATGGTAGAAGSSGAAGAGGAPPPPPPPLCQAADAEFQTLPFSAFSIGAGYFGAPLSAANFTITPNVACPGSGDGGTPMADASAPDTPDAGGMMDGGADSGMDGGSTGGNGPQTCDHYEFFSNVDGGASAGWAALTYATNPASLCFQNVSALHFCIAGTPGKTVLIEAPAIGGGTPKEPYELTAELTCYDLDLSGVAWPAEGVSSGLAVVFAPADAAQHPGADLNGPMEVYITDLRYIP